MKLSTLRDPERAYYWRALQAGGSEQWSTMATLTNHGLNQVCAATGALERPPHRY